MLLPLPSCVGYHYTCHLFFSPRLSSCSSCVLQEALLTHCTTVGTTVGGSAVSREDLLQPFAVVVLPVKSRVAAWSLLCLCQTTEGVVCKSCILGVPCAAANAACSYLVTCYVPEMEVRQVCLSQKAVATSPELFAPESSLQVEHRTPYIVPPVHDMRASGCTAGQA